MADLSCKTTTSYLRPCLLSSSKLTTCLTRTYWNSITAQAPPDRPRWLRSLKTRASWLTQKSPVTPSKPDPPSIASQDLAILHIIMKTTRTFMICAPAARVRTLQVYSKTTVLAKMTSNSHNTIQSSESASRAVHWLSTPVLLASSSFARNRRQKDLQNSSFSKKQTS